MLVFEQRLSARNLGRGIGIKALLVHGVEAKGWRMKFALLKAEIEIEAAPEVYRELARRLKAPNVHVRPARHIKIVTPKALGSPGCTKSGIQQAGLVGSSSQNKQIYCQDGNEVKASSPECVSPGAILPDLPQHTADDVDKNGGLSKDASSSETHSWLCLNRFQQHAATFTNFSGADLLRLTRDDLIQICGLADGIRLYNALHAKRIEPRLTLYVSWSGCNVFSALYLHACKATELIEKLRAIVQDAPARECSTVVVVGPGDTRVLISDEVVRHLPDHGTYLLHYLHHEHVLQLTSTHN